MNFENLTVWKRSATLSADLYLYFKKLTDHGFIDQITRSGLSIPSNIAEGMTRMTNPDKHKFLGYAYSSCAELRTQIHIGAKIQYIDRKTSEHWLNETNEISAMIKGLDKAIN